MLNRLFLLLSRNTRWFYLRLTDVLSQTKSKRFLWVMHFSVLLNAWPSIFDLSLYGWGSEQQIVTRYAIAPERFESLGQLNKNNDALVNDQSIVNQIEETEQIFKQFLNDDSIQDLENYCQSMVLEPEIKLFKMRSEYDEYDICVRYMSTISSLNYELIAASFSSLYGQDENKTSQFSALQDEIQLWLNQQDWLYDASTIIPMDYSPLYYHRLLTSISVQESQDDDFLEVNHSTLKNEKGFSAIELISVLTWYVGLMCLILAIVVGIKNKMFITTVLLFIVPSFNYVSHYLGEWSIHQGSQIESVFLVQISLLWLLFTAKLRSKVFTAFLLIAFVSVLIPVYFGELIMQSDQQILSYSLSNALLILCIFIIFMLMVRLLIKGAKENTKLLKSVGWRINLRSMFHALYLWLPMAVLCLPFFYLSYFLIPNAVTSHLHQNMVLLDSYDDNSNVLDNGLKSSAYHYDKTRLFWFLYVHNMRKELIESGQTLQNVNLSESVSTYFDLVVPRKIHFKINQSNKRFLIGPVVNTVNKQTQKGLQKSFSRLRGQIKRNLMRIANEKQGVYQQVTAQSIEQALEQLNLVYVAGKESIDKSELSTQASLVSIFNGLYIYHFFMTLIFVYICVKSYLYVFSRVCFHQQNNILVTLDNQDADQINTAHTAICALGNEFVLNPDQQTYYVARQYQLRGAAPNLKFIQCFGAPLARLLSGRFALNKVNVNANENQISCSSTQGIEYFEWNLQAGECVLFDMKNFVGMSGSLKLSTLISPKLSSLLLGKIFFSQATGPGRLILVAKGKAQICNNPNQTIQSLPPERMIAMNIKTQFYVDSELDFLNLYFSQAYIKPILGSMLIDVDTQGKIRSGSSAFIKHFLLPG